MLLLRFSRSWRAWLPWPAGQDAGGPGGDRAVGRGDPSRYRPPRRANRRRIPRRAGVRGRGSQSGAHAAWSRATIDDHSSLRKQGLAPVLQISSSRVRAVRVQISPATDGQLIRWRGKSGLFAFVTGKGEPIHRILLGGRLGTHQANPADNHQDPFIGLIHSGLPPNISRLYYAPTAFQGWREGTFSPGYRYTGPDPYFWNCDLGSRGAKMKIAAPIRVTAFTTSHCCGATD